MSKSSELHALRHSFSGDKQVTAQSRSGDKSESGAILWDFIAHTQSAEADIIEAEERAEQAEAKSEFAKLLRLYFKKILSAGEYKFLAACIRANKSLYAVGKSQGVKYKEVIESITAKSKQNEKEFFLLMVYTGYDCRRGCEFMSQIFNGNKRRRDIRAKLEAKKEARRNWNAEHKDKMREAGERWRAKHKDEFSEAVKRSKAKNKDKIREYMREYKRKYRATPKGRAKHNEEVRKSKARHCEHIKEYNREYYAANREYFKEYQKKYIAANREKIKEYQAKYRAKKNAEKEQQAIEEARA